MWPVKVAPSVLHEFSKWRCIWKVDGQDSTESSLWHPRCCGYNRVCTVSSWLKLIWTVCVKPHHLDRTFPGLVSFNMVAIKFGSNDAVNRYVSWVMLSCRCHLVGCIVNRGHYSTISIRAKQLVLVHLPYTIRCVWHHPERKPWLSIDFGCWN